MKKLVLHLGAHRCGSTAIQSLLRREHDVLEGAGIGVFLRADMTAGGFDLRRLHRYRRANPIWRSKLAKTARAIAAMPQQILVVSEENIMGTMPAVRSTRFYPHFSNLVQSLVKLSELSKDSLETLPRVVVRRQDHFLESVYAFRVSRGLAAGFDDFIKAATQTRISWLGLARAFEGVPPSISPAFALLEAWPKPTAAAQALEFLIGENSIELSQQRLTGNIRRSVADLSLMLAMSRAQINWQNAAWKNLMVNQNKAGTDDGREAIDVLKQNVSVGEFQRFEAHYSKPGKFGFDDAERAEFIQSYVEENNQFLRMGLVCGDASVWS